MRRQIVAEAFAQRDNGIAKLEADAKRVFECAIDVAQDFELQVVLFSG